jgi:murein DD-endopeptidase MepM/ murein hydrolase activator NlpD
VAQLTGSLAFLRHRFSSSAIGARRAQTEIARFLRCGIGLAACVVFGCAPQNRTHGTYHVVRPGENLYRIGKAYDVRHDEIARLNNIADPDRIRVGQQLFIPGAARQLPVEVITPADARLDASPSPNSAFFIPLTDQAFIWPISGTINSRFGPRGSGFHDGVDIAAPEGTPILAIESGAVIYSDRLRGYGNMVVVRHASGFVSVYAHNQRNLVGEGQRVSRGETIARVGSTGRVTGPHLHFEIRHDNKALDPLPYMPRLCCSEFDRTGG